MASLVDYRTQVQDLGYDGLSSTVIDRAVQQARRRVMGDRRWSWLEDDSTALTLTAGDRDISLAAVADLLHIDAVRLLDGTTPTGAMDWAPVQLVRDMHAQYPRTGVPFVWSRHRGQLIFYPTPDAAYTVDLDYVIYPGDLAAGQDIVPDALRDLVVWAAVVPLAFRQREIDRASAADRHYRQTLLPAAWAEDGRKQRQTSSRVRTGYWD